MQKETIVRNYDDGCTGIFEKVNGKYHGLWRIAYPNGVTKWERQEYKDRTHGYDRNWNDNGQILEETYYWKGLRNGISTKWYENGVTKEQAEWDMNRLLWNKSFDSNGQLLEDKIYSSKLNFQYIKNRLDITEDYKSLVKYEQFDPQKDHNADVVLNTLKRQSILLEKTSILSTKLSTKSFIGDVTLCKAGENWPELHGEYLFPVLQLQVEDLPIIPMILSDISYIMVFINPDGYDYYNDDSLCIRTYKNDDLVQISKPNTLIDTAHKIQFRITDDWPSDDLPPGILEYIEDKYLDKKLDGPYKCAMGTKVSGWPSWIQTSEISHNWQFVMQIDEYGEEFWDWGDSPTLYIFRHLVTREFSCSVQMF